MQEKKNIRLLILLGVLSVITVLVYWSSHSRAGLSVDPGLFRIANLEEVDEVLMESGNGNLTLKFDGTRWMANSSVADRNLVDVLFATLAQAEPRRPLAKALRDSIDSGLRKEGIHVTLFSEGNRAQEFYAGGNPQKTQAYFTGEDGIPYYMVIPGYRVYVSGIFELQEHEWRDKYVFGFNWRNFKSLTARFPENPQHNFKVSNQDGFFGLEGIKTDTTKLNELMNQIFLLTVDQYVDASVLDTRDTLISLSIFDIGEREYTLSLFQDEENPQVRGVVNGSFGAFFSAPKINPLLRGKDYYILREGQ